MIHDEKTVARFWARVDRRGPDECWPWTAATHKIGYGHFLAFGQSRQAHRIAYEITIGPIPPGLNVLHRCDVRACCNPAHLWLGTQLDNMRDCKAKGRNFVRNSRGVKNPGAKLTENDVRKIRKMLAAGRRQVDIARLFGVQNFAISKISLGERWGWLS